MSILIFLIVSYLLLSFSLYLLFPKAGVDAVKGLIPGVNFVEWCKLIGQKPTHALWLLFPIVNIFIFAGMAVDMVRSFGKLGFKHSAAAVIYAPAAFYKIATNPHDKYVGPTLDREADYAKKLEDAKAAGDAYKLKQLEENNPYKKSVAREWVESIVFAVFFERKHHRLLTCMFISLHYMVPHTVGSIVSIVSRVCMDTLLFSLSRSLCLLQRLHSLTHSSNDFSRVSR